MILSASRRTDIPAYYSDWFLNRIKKGFLYVRNPVNPRQISRINITPDVTDCIVFWTKNPAPMFTGLDELKDYIYYFQFTLTGYGKDMETNIPDKEKIMIPVFLKLSEKVGKERVIWRYDPIIFTPKYNTSFHLQTFEKYCGYLSGYTDKCVISFVDMYAKIKKNLERFEYEELSNARFAKFAAQLADIAHAHNIELSSCAEAIDLEACGISHNSCIDKTLIEKLTGYELTAAKDKSQRPECGCMESIDVGTYDTCPNGCIYCYANASPAAVGDRRALYDAASPLLCSPPPGPLDKITERKVKSLKGASITHTKQMSLFDMY